MSVARRISLGFCLLLAFASTVSAQTAKPASSGGGRATIYFLRPMPLMSWATAPDIRLNGKRVVELGVGSYFTVSAPRGQHKIAVQGGVDFGTESDLQVEAGKSYFLEVGLKGHPAPGQQLLTRIFGNNTMGQQMPGRGFMGSYTFYLLSVEEGRAKIAKLKKVGR